MKNWQVSIDLEHEVVQKLSDGNDHLVMTKDKFEYNVEAQSKDEAIEKAEKLLKSENFQKANILNSDAFAQ